MLNHKHLLWKQVLLVGNRQISLTKQSSRRLFTYRGDSLESIFTGLGLWLISVGWDLALQQQTDQGTLRERGPASTSDIMSCLVRWHVGCNRLHCWVEKLEEARARAAETCVIFTKAWQRKIEAVLLFCGSELNELWTRTVFSQINLWTQTVNGTAPQCRRPKKRTNFYIGENDAGVRLKVSCHFWSCSVVQGWPEALLWPHGIFFRVLLQGNFGNIGVRLWCDPEVWILQSEGLILLRMRVPQTQDSNRREC